MFDYDKYTKLVCWHFALEHFDYNKTIDWAIELIRRGIETENILIVASFSKPVDSYEIKPYISGVIKDLGLEEKYSKYSIVANAHYHLDMIIENQEILYNLRELYELYNNNTRKFDLLPFYLLYHAWSDLELHGFNFYYEGVTLKNIEETLKSEATQWLNKYVRINTSEY